MGAGRERRLRRPRRRYLRAAVFFYAAFRSPMVMLADVVALERARSAGTTYGRLRLWGSVGFLMAALAIVKLANGLDVTPADLLTRPRR
jgi:hypothetical protein